jgi:hypothetical protein
MIGWILFGLFVGIVAKLLMPGDPIEPIPQTERVKVPKTMLGRGEAFALRVKGMSMRDDGIFPGDVVVVQKQHTVMPRLRPTIANWRDGGASSERHGKND